MLRLGLRALRVYDPETKAWGQVHSRARCVFCIMLTSAFHMMCSFLILRALTEIQDPILTIVPHNGSYIIRLDRSRIVSHGIPVVANLLKHIGVYR